MSVEASSIFAIPDDVDDPRAAAQALAPLLGMSPREVYDKLAADRGFVWVRRQIEPEVGERVRAKKIAGIHLVNEPRRFYPKGHLASAVLGFVGTDDKGLAGLEHLYDDAIRGKPGELVALTDARRSRYGEAETANSRPAQEGASLVLSLDSGVQFAAERELAAAMAEHRAKSGSVVVLDPWNGEILAMASAPDFDPERLRPVPAGGAAQPRHRRRLRAGLHVQDRDRRAGPRVRPGRARRADRHGRRDDPRREHDHPGGGAPPLRRAHARRASSSIPPTSASSASGCGWARAACSRAPAHSAWDGRPEWTCRARTPGSSGR